MTKFYDIYILRKHEFNSDDLRRTCNFVFLEEIMNNDMELAFLSEHFLKCAKGSSA